jgi:arylsulfatase A-like enzyme
MKYYMSLLVFALLIIAGKYALQNKTSANILIINMSGLSKDSLSVYGKAQSFTPNLDLFFTKALVFQNNYTVSYHPYRAQLALLTGLYPELNKHYTVSQHSLNRAEQDLLKYDKSLTSILKKANYETITDSKDWIRPFAIDNEADIAELFKQLKESKEKNKKFFANIGFNSLINNQMSPESYNLSLQQKDLMVGELFNYLTKEKLFDETLIIFTSGTGSALFDNYHDKSGNPVNFNFEARNFLEKIIKTALVIKFPHNFKINNLALDQMTNTTDILPTILGFLDLPIDQSIEGNNLLRTSVHRSMTVGFSRSRDLGFEKYSTDGEYIFIDTDKRGRALIDVKNKIYYDDKNLKPFAQKTEVLNAAIEEQLKRNLMFKK